MAARSRRYEFCKGRSKQRPYIYLYTLDPNGY